MSLRGAKRGGNPDPAQLRRHSPTRERRLALFHEGGAAFSVIGAGEAFVDQFDEMLEQSRKYPLVFAVSAHPFIIGQPFRLRAFRGAVRHILERREELWITTPGEIARYCESLPEGTIPGSG